MKYRVLPKKNLLMSILFQGPIYIKWTGTRKSEANQKLSTKIKSESKAIHGAKRKRIKSYTWRTSTREVGDGGKI